VVLYPAKIEVAERVLAVDPADIQWLRQIAGNHLLFSPQSSSLLPERPARLRTAYSGAVVDSEYKLSGEKAAGTDLLQGLARP
jgi:hypothetical protein